MPEPGPTDPVTAPPVAAPAIADAEQRAAAYHEGAPDDLLNLATAVNVLLYEPLRDAVFARARVERDDLRYATPPYGPEPVRRGVARLLNRVTGGRVFWQDVFAATGVSGALECLAFALRDAGALRPGDRVLVPAPSWQGFPWCFGQRPGLHCVPVPLTGFELNLADVRRAYHAQPPRPRLLVLTNPANPLGVNHPRTTLEEIVRWAVEETDMHVISDEIYTFSQVDGASPAFTSVLSLDAYPWHTDRIHLVWGLAKDFGLTGFRIGFVVSRAAAVRRAMTGGTGRAPMAWFGPLDSLKAAYAGLLFDERTGTGEQWLPVRLMEQYRELLTGQYRAVSAELGKHPVPWVGRGTHRNPAQFLLLDLRRYLDRVPCRAGGAPPPLYPEIDPGEERLRRYVEDRARVLLLPGQMLSCPEPGYFRLCFTAYGRETMVRAARAIGEAVRELDRPPLSPPPGCC
ncbi:pyridoxal phosphate-dependent aminotransferase [Streptomyces sp. URMC 129]|uniref:pyridoxal phosphate-dependent aminotransferase n=1 Tax=Streptomyces sp. URMC 129 TaxID=3423407 RepID=UPI003F1DC941